MDGAPTPLFRLRYPYFRQTRPSSGRAVAPAFGQPATRRPLRGPLDATRDGLCRSGRFSRLALTDAPPNYSYPCPHKPRARAPASPPCWRRPAPARSSLHRLRDFGLFASARPGGFELPPSPRPRGIRLARGRGTARCREVFFHMFIPLSTSQQNRTVLTALLGS